ncbi:GNAT family N-acetyltransferase [Paenibacillus sp. GCM10027626]|uniref:GNAT family N-acetyltransferase n=1 Tax=Paenibacillus sp. GCM10027626 TaxID=3273411 RepID=UPI0036323FBA
MEKAYIGLQLQQIKEDDCVVQAIVEGKDGQTVILYTPYDRYHIYARIVYCTGVATKRYRNDPVFFLEWKPGTRCLILSYIRILQDKINCGYGSIMMNYLLEEMVEKQGIDSILGFMQETANQEHEERLRHFYTKFGFNIDEARNLSWHRNNK